MTDFMKALDDCGFQDLGFRGCPFTWSNGRCQENLVSEKLDRGVASLAWLDLFPMGMVKHEISSAYDHNLILAHLFGEMTKRRSRKRLVRFEAIWVKKSSCEKIIEERWRVASNVGGSDIIAKIKAM
ncbi:hypothetical protein CFOL_v3_00984 [Cephalotus follicularis]|uniref:Exo_endo_phos domain-containing protein n=1 Tax=Cephalotus follicularis TaxID=3775 RepID=A0A1Q3ANW6_CEPFO|nr:hypothetical protein CFOL_v3_00984 [Cephalotus follicularis]